MEFSFDPSVRVLCSQVEDGSMSLFDDSLKKNLPIFLQKNNINFNYAYCRQQHGPKIKLINESGDAGECDGIITLDDIPLVVRTADCIPVAFVDQNKIGILHCGRKSLISGIIQTLKNKLDSPTSTKIFIGPCIRVSSYEVKQDVVREVKNTKWEQFLLQRSERYYFNLVEALFFALDELGIKRENIIDSGIDTYLDERFFSYRRDLKEDIKTFVTLICKNGSK